MCGVLVCGVLVCGVLVCGVLVLLKKNELAKRNLNELFINKACKPTLGLISKH